MKGWCLQRLFWLACLLGGPIANVHPQDNLADYPCLSNKKIQYGFKLISSQWLDGDRRTPMRLFAYLEDSACIGAPTPSKIQMIRNGLKDENYDWACNIALYAIYKKEAWGLDVIKPRRWRKVCKDQEIAYWNERLGTD